MSLSNSRLLTVTNSGPEQALDGEALSAKAAEIASRLSVKPARIETYLDVEDGHTLTIVELGYDLDGNDAAAAYRNFLTEWVNEVPLQAMQGSTVLLSCVPSVRVPESA